MSRSPKRTQISTDVALRDIVNKKEQMLRFEAGIGLISDCTTIAIHRCGGSVGIASPLIITGDTHRLPIDSDPGAPWLKSEHPSDTSARKVIARAMQVNDFLPIKNAEGSHRY